MANECVLIVEDEVIVAMEIESRLHRLGYRVAGPVRTGEEAIETVRREAPDLVLMDIRLAGPMDGIAAAARITSGFDIPVVYLSAYTDDETLRRAKISEPFGYLIKPFEERELHSALEIALYKHRVEQRLRESELRYRSLFEHAGDAIFILAAEGDDAGRIVEANRAADEMHGYAPGELVGRNISDLDAPADAAAAAARLRRILAGDWLRTELNHRRQDGTIFPVEISARLLTLGGKRYVLALDRDITERRQAEIDVRLALAQARDERLKTEAIIAALGDGISVQSRDFTILYQNNVHRGFVGDHVGERCYLAYERQDEICEGCPVAKSFQDGLIHRMERCVKTDAGVVHLAITTSPVRDAGGEIIAGVEIVRDITEEREREMRLIMSERLASLGQMASGIAHEINNPLAAILGCTEGLQRRVREGKFEPEFFLSYLAIIEEEITRCKGITMGMLSFVRQSTYEMKSINLNELLTRTIDIIGIQGRIQKVAVARYFSADLPEIQGSEGELRQVFLTLMGNAVDAMGGGGTLTLTTSCDGAEVSVVVGDTGGGIRKEHLDKIFEPFFTTKAEQGGTGLGLSIARKIVMNHHGRISVVSESGRGTFFTVNLPIVQSATS